MRPSWRDAGLTVFTRPTLSSAHYNGDSYYSLIYAKQNSFTLKTIIILFLLWLLLFIFCQLNCRSSVTWSWPNGLQVLALPTRWQRRADLKTGLNARKWRFFLIFFPFFIYLYLAIFPKQL